MTRTLRSEDLSVGELLGGDLTYEIPVFQRDYAWSVDEAGRLLEDLATLSLDVDDATETVPYFLGTMLFVVGNGASEPRAFAALANGKLRGEAAGRPEPAHIIDGQQRLVTLTILLAALRDLSEVPSDRARAGAAIERQAGGTHPTEPIAAAAADEEPPPLRLSPRESDGDFFWRFVQRPGATKLPASLAENAARSESQRRMQAVRALYVTRLRRMAAAERSSITAFVLDRCRALAVWSADIDYAYQIFLSINRPGLPLTEEDVVLAEVVGPLTRQQRQRFQPILQQMARYREPKPAGRRQAKTFFTHLAHALDWVSERMISRLRRAVVDAGGPTPFAQSVFHPLAEAYIATRDPASAGLSPVSRHTLDRLAILERFCDDEWVPAAMLGLTRLGDSPGDLDGFLAELERFAFALAALRPIHGERRSIYRRLCETVRLAPSTPPRTLFALDAQQERAALRRMAQRPQFVTNGFSKALLIRLDMEFSGRPASAYATLLDEAHLTVEHVLPCGRTLPRKSDWRRHFPNGDERRAIAEGVANLILLEHRLNSTAEQRDFADKKLIFFEASTPHPLVLTEELRAIDDWSPEVLTARQRRLVEAIARLWRLPAENDDFALPQAPAARETKHRKATTLKPAAKDGVSPSSGSPARGASAQAGRKTPRRRPPARPE
ncbi:MAG: DUF262 domain-containing HNH endonuclease family protein [Hyphomicrobiaceae bacterium]|nr:DUF262 domain-containing HNH endonuclease family protein [Hyphomicrobiaceae bacterium]